MEHAYQVLGPLTLWTLRNHAPFSCSTVSFYAVYRLVFLYMQAFIHTQLGCVYIEQYLTCKILSLWSWGVRGTASCQTQGLQRFIMLQQKKIKIILHCCTRCCLRNLLYCQSREHCEAFYMGDHFEKSPYAIQHHYDFILRMHFRRVSSYLQPLPISSISNVALLSRKTTPRCNNMDSLLIIYRDKLLPHFGQFFESLTVIKL